MVFFCCPPALLLIVLIVVAAQLPSAAATIVVDGPTTYTGTCDDAVCSWLGVRYAAAPVGPLRFAPPQPLPSPGPSQSATEMGPRCPQAGSTDGQDEDCLFLNIQRTSTAPLSKKLPVLVFFHGGGFETGSGNDNDPRALLQVGRDHDQDAVIVRINYRLGLLGFLASSEFEDLRNSDARNVGLNNGFKDMKAATRWVKAHIDAFGGDADRVTIWGQSAGSFGASALLLGYPDGAPFRSAILESGAPGGVPVSSAASKDTQYDRVLSSARCDSADDHLACLRALPWQDLRAISVNESTRAQQPGTYIRGYYAWNAILDGGPDRLGFFSARPSVVIKEGAFARVPVLHGDCEDEGTYFAPHIFNDEQSFSDWLATVYFADPKSSSSATLLSQVLEAYPDIPADGSPYDPVGASPNDRFFGPTNQFKRAASVYGDLRYQANRRLFLGALAKNNVKAYSYLYAQVHEGDAASVGVPHGSDLSALLQSAPNALSVTYARQYLAFAASADPNAASGLPRWPTYSASGRRMLEYRDNTIRTITDDFRDSAMDVLNSASILRVTGR